jgi:hypothetical protein
MKNIQKIFVIKNICYKEKGYENYEINFYYSSKKFIYYKNLKIKEKNKRCYYYS